MCNLHRKALPHGSRTSQSILSKPEVENRQLNVYVGESELCMLTVGSL